MKAIKDFNDIIKILRNTIIIQSQLPAERVLNSLSLEGTELDKLLEESRYNSIEQEDTTILFELNSTPQSNSNVSMEEGDISTIKELTCGETILCDNSLLCGEEHIDRAITYYRMYNLHLVLYGQDSSFTAVKLSSRMRSQEVKSNLYAKGIYIESVSNPESINEFKNDIMWLRNDVTINLGVKFLITQVYLTPEYEKIKDIQIIKEENYE